MIGLSALFTSCITPAASWPTAASRRSRERASCSASSSCVRSCTIRSRRSASVDTRSYSSAVRRASSSSAFASCVFTRHVALDGHRAANLSVLVVERIGVHLDDDRRAVGAAANGERLAAHTLAAQRARRRMLVHEQARAIDRARTVELPELAQRRRLPGRMILHGLRVRAHRAPFGVEYAHGIRNDVEDRLELRDVAAEGFTELFSLADVVAGEQNAAAARTPRSACANVVSISRRAGAVLKRHATPRRRRTPRNAESI